MVRITKEVPSAAPATTRAKRHTEPFLRMRHLDHGSKTRAARWHTDVRRRAMQRKSSSGSLLPDPQTQSLWRTWLVPANTCASEPCPMENLTTSWRARSKRTRNARHIRQSSSRSNSLCAPVIEQNPSLAEHRPLSFDIGKNTDEFGRICPAFDPDVVEMVQIWSNTVQIWSELVNM